MADSSTGRDAQLGGIHTDEKAIEDEMSIKLISAIFATEFNDLRDAAGHVTKGSTAKFVLLALADHANDQGKGAYPGLTRMECKTALTRKTIVNALDALKFNGMISLVGRSKFNTSNYTILIQALPGTDEDGVTSTPPMVAPVHQDVVISTPPMEAPVHQDGVFSTPPMVAPEHQDGVFSRPAMVAPVHLNRPLTTLKPSNDIYISQNDFQKVLSALEELCGPVAMDTTRLINTWLEKHPLERIQQAIDVAGERRARSPKYIDQVLISWEANGYPPSRAQQIFAGAFKPRRGQYGEEKPRYKIPDYSEADLAVIEEINRRNALEEEKELEEGKRKFPCAGTEVRAV